jgi:hypothetical protein
MVGEALPSSSLRHHAGVQMSLHQISFDLSSRSDLPKGETEIRHPSDC